MSTTNKITDKITNKITNKISKKILLIVLDGVFDRPIKSAKSRDGKTPLQAAKTPNFDKFTKKGVGGISDPISPGVVPGSDTAHLALFGYDPYKFYAGRGVLEALGENIPLYPGDLAFRCNFATTVTGAEISDRRAGRIDNKSASTLSVAIKHLKIGDFDFLFNHTMSHRGVLIIRGKKGNTPNPRITDTDQHSLGPINWSKPMTDDESARKTANVLNEWTKKVYQILKNHEINKKREKEKLLPANIVLARGPSSLVEGASYKGTAVYDGPNLSEPVSIQKFEDKYDLKAVAIAGGTLYKGVARYLGMDVITVKGATADINTDIDAKVNAVKKELSKNDFIFLHIKGTDVLSHDGKFKEKTKFIEKIDKKIKPLLELADKDTIVVLTADHSTPVSLKAHSGDPVPIVIAGTGVRPDKVQRYDELSLAIGGLNRIRHINIMPIVLDLIGKGKMFGT